MNANSVPERLRDLAESLEGDEWMHPLCSVEACHMGAAIATAYLSQCERRLKEQIELRKLREGFAWTRLKEETLSNEFWLEVDYELKRKKDV